ncbi:unnamed protein product [Brassica oleracea var. botrytis]
MELYTTIQWKALSWTQLVAPCLSRSPVCRQELPSSSSLSPRSRPWTTIVASAFPETCSIWCSRTTRLTTMCIISSMEANTIFSQPFFSMWDRILGTYMPYSLEKREDGGFEERPTKEFKDD